MRLPMIAAAVALAALPLAGASAFADEASSAKNLKGPPNANGYGHEQGATTTNDEHGSDGKDMKGPPNANGYQK